MASKDGKARHRRGGRRANVFAWPGGGRGRLRSLPASGGLIAVSAVVLAASAASAAPLPENASPEVRERPAQPRQEPASANGGTVPEVDFPVVRTYLTSGRFVGSAIPTAPASATGSIPATVLAAYQRAVDRTNAARPSCHLPLELVAAIGKVESGHARGGRVDETGRTLTPILGPVLNGGPFAAIADTDGGALDGDTSWDRAVGPMQFIPGTWARWGSDGNADGERDPQNVYDAALAAARYLCAANRDLGTPEGLDQAILSYNHSTSYLSLVRSWMAVYRNGTVSVDDVLAQEAAPPEATTPSPPPSPAPPPSTPPSSPAPTPPPSTPPTTPPPSTPPPTTPPPTTPPPTTPPPTTDPSTPPPATDPTTPPPATDPPATDPTTPPAGQPAGEPPSAEPAEQCGLVDTVGDVVGGLLGEDPACVHALELSTPETTASPAE